MAAVRVVVVVRDGLAWLGLPGLGLERLHNFIFRHRLPRRQKHTSTFSTKNTHASATPYHLT